jgi:hypothetical protein
MSGEFSSTIEYASITRACPTPSARSMAAASPARPTRSPSKLFHPPPSVTTDPGASCGARAASARAHSSFTWYGAPKSHTPRPAAVARAHAASMRSYADSRPPAPPHATPSAPTELRARSASRSVSARISKSCRYSTRPTQRAISAPARWIPIRPPRNPSTTASIVPRSTPIRCTRAIR